MNHIVLDMNDISKKMTSKFEETRFEKNHNVIFEGSNEGSIEDVI